MVHDKYYMCTNSVLNMYKKYLQCTTIRNVEENCTTCILSISINPFAAIIHWGGSAPPDASFKSAVGPPYGLKIEAKLKARM